MLFYEHNAG